MTERTDDPPIVILRRSSGVVRPLWHADGEPYDEDDELLDVILGLPMSLVFRLEEWACSPRTDAWVDAEGVELARRLTVELAPEVVAYEPRPLAADAPAELVYVVGGREGRLPLWTTAGGPWEAGRAADEIADALGADVVDRLVRWDVAWRRTGDGPQHDPAALELVHDLAAAGIGRVGYLPTTDATPPPLARFLPEPGATYSGALDGEWDGPPAGEVIDLMGGPRDRVPLVWEERLFEEPEELIAALGVSPELTSELVDWAIAWQDEAGQPDHDAWAKRLVERLNAEVGGKYTFGFHRWVP